MQSQLLLLIQDFLLQVLAEVDVRLEKVEHLLISPLQLVCVEVVHDAVKIGQSVAFFAELSQKS